MNLRPAVQGDVNDTRIVRLDGVEDLHTANTIRVHIRNTRAGYEATLDGEVEDPDARLVRFSLGGPNGWLASLDVTMPTTYLLEIEVGFADGTVLTFPAPQAARIDVRPQLDPP